MFGVPQQFHFSGKEGSEQAFSRGSWGNVCVFRFIWRGRERSFGIFLRRYRVAFIRWQFWLFFPCWSRGWFWYEVVWFNWFWLFYRVGFVIRFLRFFGSFRWVFLCVVWLELKENILVLSTDLRDYWSLDSISWTRFWRAANSEIRRLLCWDFDISLILLLSLLMVESAGGYWLLKTELQKRYMRFLCRSSESFGLISIFSFYYLNLAFSLLF